MKGITDIGAVRTNNEDAYWIDDRDHRTRSPGEAELVIVADGMGGHEKGEEASRIAVEVLHGHLAGTVWDELEHDQDLIDAFNEANAEIRRFDAGQPDAQKGMGTTVAVALLSDEQALIGWVGDSRIYRARGGRLERLTDDHSFVEQLVRSGEITEEEARSHPLRNRITSALGPFARPPEVGTRLIELEPMDALLLCTDGMWEPLSDGELEDQIAGQRIEDALQGAVAAAIDAGGTDNITGVIVSPNSRIPGPGPVQRARESARSAERRMGKARSYAIVGSVLAVIAVLIWALFLRSEASNPSRKDPGYPPNDVASTWPLPGLRSPILGADTHSVKREPGPLRLYRSQYPESADGPMTEPPSKPGADSIYREQGRGARL